MGVFYGLLRVDDVGTTILFGAAAACMVGFRIIRRR
jgi:hypothetical protein